MNVVCANMGRMQRPLAVTANLLDRLQHDAPARLIEMIRLLIHPCQFSLRDYWIGGKPGFTKLVVFDVHRATLVAVEPLAVTSPGEQIG